MTVLLLLDLQWSFSRFYKLPCSLRRGRNDTPPFPSCLPPEHPSFTLVSWAGLLYLLVGGGLLHAPAEGLRAREARRAGQAVVAGVRVLAPVLSAVAEAGVGHQLALWKEHQFAQCVGNAAKGTRRTGSLLP